MLELSRLYALGNSGGEILSRFAMAVKKRVFAIADEPDHTTVRWKAAQQVAKDRKYQYLASQLIDYASAQAGNPLSETGEAMTDAEIEQVVATYLPKVFALIG